jgi:hypothetical protein
MSVGLGAKCLMAWGLGRSNSPPEATRTEYIESWRGQHRTLSFSISILSVRLFVILVETALLLPQPTVEQGVSQEAMVLPL